MAKPKKEKDLLVGTPEAAKIIGVSAAALSHWRKKGMYMSFTMKGGRVFYKLSDVERVRDERNDATHKEGNKVLVENALANIEKSKREIAIEQAEARKRLVHAHKTQARINEEYPELAERKLDKFKSVPQMKTPPKSWPILVAWIGFVALILLCCKGFQYEVRMTTLETKIEALEEILLEH